MQESPDALSSWSQKKNTHMVSLSLCCRCVTRTKQLFWSVQTKPGHWHVSSLAPAVVTYPHLRYLSLSSSTSSATILSVTIQTGVRCNENSTVLLQKPWWLREIKNVHVCLCSLSTCRLTEIFPLVEGLKWKMKKEIIVGRIRTATWSRHLICTEHVQLSTEMRKKCDVSLL